MKQNKSSAKNWYRQIADKLAETFGPNADLIAALLAATSPQVNLQTSYKWTIQIYSQFRRGINPDLSMLYPCHYFNVLRALAGQELKGPKVQAFYRALTGDLDAVVIDTWMAKMVRYYPRHIGCPRGETYKKMAKAFANVARINGYYPAEFQAILWTDIRAKAGYKPISYVDYMEHPGQMELFETIPF